MIVSGTNISRGRFPYDSEGGEGGADQDGTRTRCASQASSRARSPELRGRLFDLILMDLNLPDLRGDDAIKIIREHMKVEVPIIVFSGEIKTDVMVKLQPLGISAFVAKGEEFVFRLGEEVDKALSSGS